MCFWSSTVWKGPNKNIVSGQNGNKLSYQNVANNDSLFFNQFIESLQHNKKFNLVQTTMRLCRFLQLQIRSWESCGRIDMKQPMPNHYESIITKEKKTNIPKQNNKCNISLPHRNPDILSNRINPSAKVRASLQSFYGKAAAQLAGISGKVPVDWPCAVSAVFAVSQPSLTIATEPLPASWSSSHTGRTAVAAVRM